jgi:putative PIG3 family NAD(P)H quinone oxidoreductase
MDSIPSIMRAIDPDKPGGPEVLVPVERPVPRPDAGELLIRVAAAGVNRPDVLQRRGLYPVPAGATTILGLEVAGTVVARGPETHRLAIGDRVVALVAGGGYAEYCVAPEVQCLPAPPTLSDAECATLVETWFTVWANLHDLGAAREGDWLLVHGGTSGIGVTAIDFARARGMPCLVTAGSDAKCAAALAKGAHHAINYREADFVTEVARVTAGRGVDLVLDMVGGDYVPRNLACLTTGGRHISIAFQRGPKVELDLPFVMRKRLTLTGSFLRPRPVAEKAAIARAIEAEIWPRIADSTIGAHLDRVFALEEAADAHRLMETGGHVGKIALTLALPSA